MDEVELLLTAVLAGIAPLDSVHHWTYRELFHQFANIDPFTVLPGEPENPGWNQSMTLPLWVCPGTTWTAGWTW